MNVNQEKYIEELSKFVLLQYICRCHEVIECYYSFVLSNGVRDISKSLLTRSSLSSDISY